MKLESALPAPTDLSATRGQLEVGIRRLDLRLTQLIHALAEHDAENRNQPARQTGVLDALEHGRIK